MRSGARGIGYSTLLDTSRRTVRLVGTSPSISTDGSAGTAALYDAGAAEEPLLLGVACSVEAMPLAGAPEFVAA
ncbi:MAG: hypothetical protein K2Y37_06440 [Pirellulales bacterium]|nr:hypothetical protein [Pirellulales bacterium]